MVAWGLQSNTQTLIVPELQPPPLCVWVYFYFIFFQLIFVLASMVGVTVLRWEPGHRPPRAKEARRLRGSLTLERHSVRPGDFYPTRCKVSVLLKTARGLVWTPTPLHQRHLRTGQRLRSLLYARGAAVVGASSRKG